MQLRLKPIRGSWPISRKACLRLRLAGRTPTAFVATLARQSPGTSQSTSRYYAIMQPAMAKSLATLNDASGSTAFPQMKPLAGELCDCTALVSDGVLGGQMVVLDASQLVAAQGDVSLRTSAHGDIEMSDAPNSPPTAYNAHFAVADK